MAASASVSSSIPRPGLRSLRIPTAQDPPPQRTFAFQQPACLTSYSMSAPSQPGGHRTAHHHPSPFANRGLALYAPCPPGADLSYGFARCTWADEARKGEEGLDDLLRAIREFERVKLGGQRVLGKGKEGFVSFRGTMTKLLTAPYDDEPLELSAQLYDGNIYLEQHKGPPREMDNRAKRMTYNGFSFESYATRPHPSPPASAAAPVPAPTPLPPPDAPRGWGGDVDCNEEWCAVVKTSLDGVRMVLGGEVDCLERPFDGTLSSAVELKTAVQPRHPGQVRRFEHKLLRFWAQSFLLGIPSVVVGFRRADPPLVDAVQRFETLALPRTVRERAPHGQPPPWEPQACLGFASAALRLVQDAVRPAGEADADGRARVWAVRLGGAGRALECWPLEPGGAEWEGRVREGARGRGKRWGILPDWLRAE